MVKKILAAAAAFIVLVGIVAAVWARSILATDTVRSAIAVTGLARDRPAGHDRRDRRVRSSRASRSISSR